MTIFHTLLVVLCSGAMATPIHSTRAAHQDGYAHKATISASQLAAEIDTLKAKQSRFELSADEADKLASLTLAANATSREEFELHSRHVRNLIDQLTSDLASAQLGVSPPGDADGRWLANRAKAKTPEARELFLRVHVDQLQPDYPSDPQDDASYLVIAASKRERINRENAAWLKGQLRKIGWFDIRIYGEEASQAAWLLVQHADFDPEWQRSVVKTLETKVASRDMQPRYYAYLVDRVSVSTGGLQLFGTQGRCMPGGSWEPKPVLEPEALDQRRLGAGLQPIEEYKKLFRC